MALLEHPQLEHVRRNARRYSVTTRTVYRWIGAGVNIEDPAAVAAYLVTQRNPSRSAMESCKIQLLSELSHYETLR
jgi:hypothetical protein